jgi:uncharacterized phage-associated protein
MLTALQVAEYFLTLVDEEAGDSLSNLKLQKLVYYAQGFSLALTGEPLFNERIEAWQHGPVVPSLYRNYKQHGSEPVPVPEGGLKFEIYSEETRELLDEVYSVYGQFSASKLRNMTHQEPPWMEAIGTSSRLISHQTMKDYFSTLVHGEGQQT